MSSLRLGRYDVLARIATGGMGEIFLARLDGAEGFEKLYVIKRILPQFAEDKRFRSMLVSEARLVANMSHANICHVYELDESNRQLFIVMEYLEGVTLLAMLRKQAREEHQLDYGFIAGVVQQVAEGLHYAHELRSRDGDLLDIVHRDVTPSNIFLTESGVVKIHDFGVAKAADTATTANTEAGAVKGKFGYMAPEQLQGTGVDRRVDVFALGIVIAEMVTNRRLFQRKTDYLTFRAVMEQPVPELRTYRPDVPDALVDAITRALARDPAERFATVRELGTAVLEALAPIAKPWDATKISAFVRAQFSDELRDHHAEISSVCRTSRVTSRTLPVILQTPSTADETDYLAIETNIETNLVDEPVEPPAARVPARSPWPLVAILSGAALVLAVGWWLLGRGPAPVAAAAPCSVETDGVHGPYADAIHREDARLAACATAPDGAPPADLRATIRVGADGRAIAVELVPASAARGELGHCLVTALSSVVFPPAEHETEVSVSIR